jgi:hypothetical protein
VRVWDLGTLEPLHSIDVGNSIRSVSVREDNVVIGCDGGIIRLRIR